MNFKDYLKAMAGLLVMVDGGMLEQAAGLLRETASRRGKVILAGNGASAAIASHVSVDLTKTAGVRAINFNEADLLTCFANDYGYEHWVEEALKAYADPADLVILISSSGMSANMVNAARLATGMGLKVVTFSGFCSDNTLRTLGAVNFWVDSHEYNFVETVHQAWLLALVDKLADERKNRKA
ncbi:MAG: SIS domain-containing protein [Candidatus Omnitrophica bacterium]|nr:SIS domain-containing protein [Candidatus Omnitrophota bacterium]